MSNLFNVEDIKSETSLIELKKKIEDVKKLNLNEDFTGTKFFEDVLFVLGDLPPLALLEQVLSHYKRKKQKLVIDEIPSLMNAAGMSNFEMEDGTRVNLKQELSVKTLNKDSLITWLKEAGYKDNLKDTLTFGMGEFDQEAEQLLSGYSYKKESGVHYKTLERIMKERLKKQEKLPDDSIVSIDIFNIAKIKK